jgi:uncharacterized protein
MKKMLFLMLVCSFIVLSNCKPDKTYNLKYIYDYEEVLDDEQRMKFDQLFIEHEKKTGNEIVLVTTEDYGELENIELFSLDFKTKHPIGKADKDNSVLIVFSKNKSEVRITPGTYHLKMDKTGKTEFIVKKIMIPKFEKKEYFDGLWTGSQQIISFLEQNK